MPACAETMMTMLWGGKSAHAYTWHNAKSRLRPEKVIIKTGKCLERGYLIVSLTENYTKKKKT